VLKTLPIAILANSTHKKRRLLGQTPNTEQRQLRMIFLLLASSFRSNFLKSGAQ